MQFKQMGKALSPGGLGGPAPALGWTYSQFHRRGAGPRPECWAAPHRAQLGLLLRSTLASTGPVVYTQPRAGGYNGGARRGLPVPSMSLSTSRAHVSLSKRKTWTREVWAVKTSAPVAQD